MTTCISQSSVLQLLAQLIQGVVIHLATGISRGAAELLLQSLRQQAFAHHSSNARASRRCKADPNNSNKTRTYENSLVSTTSVDVLGAKRQNVRRGLEE